MIHGAPLAGCPSPLRYSFERMIDMHASRCGSAGIAQRWNFLLHFAYA